MSSTSLSPSLLSSSSSLSPSCLKYAILMAIITVVFSRETSSSYVSGNSFKNSSGSAVGVVASDDNGKDSWSGSRRKRSLDADYFKNEHVYCVIIDAGSSGSRIYIYSWKTDFVRDGEALPRLEVSAVARKDGGVHKQFVEKSANNMQDYLSPLMNHAKENIPENQHKSTDLYFMATAGMRLLVKNADAAIDQIRSVLSMKSFNPFKYKPENIKILSGEQEGVFAWVSVNYHKKVFARRGVRANKTFGLLEMGGASTQIAFIPRGSILNNLYPVRIAGVHYSVYVKSFLQFGTDYVSKKISNMVCSKKFEMDDKCDNPCFIKDGINLVNLGFTRNFSGQAKSFILEGKGNFENCQKLMEEVVYKNDNPTKCSPSPCSIGEFYQPPIPNDMKFVGIGGFKHVYKKLKLLQDDGSLNLDKALKKVEEFCSTGKSDVSEDYSKPDDKTSIYASDPCQFGLYFDTLLTRGYGFDRQTSNIFIDPDINWTLGAVLYENEKNVYGFPPPSSSSSSPSSSFRNAGHAIIMVMKFVSIPTASYLFMSFTRSV
ncbi:hypothetical protein HELRODRAFT_174430 [Helobdella robusta]|uniref:Ectonucleoside triphosphate diphosphohydrolase 1 n=1 Tax=Helobdella robusta TaxID=6412 RepID=T1F842_HELRO|nr:hypothetical protein HELRODRAFT_174430 [Helobdella robusta]ESO01483.1 hypothetical protein HELRODRAFT_174430 [Helobdella robusta]